jgi:replicative DNA helicase
MTVTLEKVFLDYILKNRKFYDVVQPFFFKNNEIQFVYRVIRDYILKNPSSDRPSPRQILEMVKLEDQSGVITKEILKSILDINPEQYDEESFILPYFRAWILRNRIRAGSVDILDETRGLDDIRDFMAVTDIADKIRSIADDMTSLSFVMDDELCSDFDNPEHHVQDFSRFKIRSGFETIDTMLGGGWDVNTLNIVMAETNGGKSLWMQNFAVRTADMGKNVLYVTLEMSETKVMKRLGSMRLRIPINEYDEASKDVEFMRQKIEDLRRPKPGSDLFGSEPGKIYCKFWAAGTVTVPEISSYVGKLQQRTGKKIDLIIIDYITLIAPLKGMGDSLYLKGKHLAEGLRAIGAKYTCPVVTGVQVAKDAWNSSDITLESVPESKAIAETADTFFAIIRTEEMRRQNLYRFKLLKQRDGDFLKSQIRLDLNVTYLTLENDRFIDA